jgi:hypothetical protein
VRDARAARDARAHLGPRAQNQELQQREHQSAALPSVAERLLDIEGITDAYLAEGGAVLVARVHPRWSDILVVNIACLRSRLGSEVNILPEATNATHTFRTVSLASQNRLGPPGLAQPPATMRMAQALAISLFGATCPRTCYNAWKDRIQFCWNVVDERDILVVLVVNVCCTDVGKRAAVLVRLSAMRHVYRKEV